MAANDTARLSRRFTLSVPKAMCVAQGWRAGQEFAFVPKGAGVLLVPVPKIEALAGIVPKRNRD